MWEVGCIFRQSGGCTVKVAIEKRKRGGRGLSGCLREEHSSRMNCDYQSFEMSLSLEHSLKCGRWSRSIDPVRNIN
jgi:hypothetical protein